MLFGPSENDKEIVVAASILEMSKTAFELSNFIFSVSI